MRNFNILTLVAVFILAVSAFSGCGTTTEKLAIEGSYADSWGTTHTITSQTWTQTLSGTDTIFHITDFDNTAMYAIAQNDSNNEFNPDLWSRFDWTTTDAGLWFCTTAYDKATRADALNTADADASDPANSGCGGFGWTQLTAK